MKKFLLSGILIMLLIGCRDTSRVSFEPLYTPTYASGFTIEAAGDSSTVITVRNPWQGADSVTYRLFIARGGETPPEGFEGQVLEVDARRIAVMSSTHVAMLDALGETDRIAAASGVRYISSPRIDPDIPDVGYEGAIDYEKLLGARPDLVMLYGVSSASAMESKLDELGIPYIYMGEYLEESPLGKAEWVVAAGEVTGHREEARRLFSAIPARYDSLKAAVARATETAPRVLVNAPYGDTWFMPSSSSYAARLITDAGGTNLFTEATGNSSAPVDPEKAYLMAADADVWLNPGTAESIEQLGRMTPRFTDIPPVREGRVYNNNLRTNAAGGNDYYESGVMHPDLILADLIRILHPGVLPEGTFTYYRHLE